MFCSNCGKELEDSNICCPSCGRKVGAAPITSSSAQSEKPSSQVVLSRRKVAIGFLLIITGAIMMLTALALHWYTVDYYKKFLDSGDLLNRNVIERRFEQDFSWYGTSLPLIFIIVFAPIAILFAVYTLVTGRRLRKPWCFLGLLPVAALIANFLYLHFTVCSDCFGNLTPHYGWVVAFIGAVAIGIGTITIGGGSKKKLLS